MNKRIFQGSRFMLLFQIRSDFLKRASHSALSVLQFKRNGYVNVPMQQTSSKLSGRLSSFSFSRLKFIVVSFISSYQCSSYCFTAVVSVAVFFNSINDDCRRFSWFYIVSVSVNGKTRASYNQFERFLFHYFT